MNFQNLPSALYSLSEKFADNLAIDCSVYGNFTYNELYNLIVDFSIQLKNLQIKKNDIVIIINDNSLVTVISFWATIMLGAIPSIVAESIDKASLNKIVNSTQAKHVIDNKQFKDNTKSYFKLNLQSLHDGKHQLSIDNANSTDLAVIIYTSGSTGEPNGVMLSHYNILSALDSLQKYLAYQATDVIMVALPLSFDYGLYQILLSLMVGAKLILTQSQLYYGNFLTNLHNKCITILPVVPSLIHRLDKAVKKNQSNTSVRLITNTGEALTLLHQRLVKQLFPQAEIIAMYGLTECKRCSYLPATDLSQKPESVGISIPNSRFWVVDTNKQPLAPGQVGELVVDSPTTMMGYWKNPQLTKKRIFYDPTTYKKLLLTGDLARVDNDGYLYLIGRKDGIEKYRGHKLSLTLLEDKLSALIQNQCVLILKATPEAEKILVLFIVDSNPNHRSKIMHKLMHLPAHEKPVILKFIKQIPLSDNGKIDRQHLQNLCI